jgi:hypothetical protein
VVVFYSFCYGRVFGILYTFAHADRLHCDDNTVDGQHFYSLKNAHISLLSEMLMGGMHYYSFIVLTFLFFQKCLT